MPPRQPDTSKTTNDLVLPGAATNGPALEFDAREPVTDPAPPTPPDVVVSPQMLLKYFAASTNASTNAATNATSLRVVAPLGFTPPVATAAAIPPPAGKATHSTSP